MNFFSFFNKIRQRQNNLKIYKNNVIYSSNVDLSSVKNSHSVKIMKTARVFSGCDIGNYTYIGYNTMIVAAKIGNYCSIANNVSIGLGEHKLDRISNHSIFYANPYEELIKKDCIIGHDVWIGVDSIIRRGIMIGNGAIIGANSFVNKNVPPFAIVAGNPAKIIKYKFNPHKIKCIQKSCWWNYDLKEASRIIENL